MQRRTRIVVAVLVAVAGGALAFVGTAPRELATVTDAAAQEPGREVEVRGTFAAGSLDRNATPLSFSLTDGAAVLPVLWDKPLPEHEAGGSLEGRQVVVRGVLETTGSGKVLRATEMQVGCASKYATA